MKGFILPKFWYYVILFTWGLPLTLIGAVVFLALMAFGYKPLPNMYGWYIVIGKGWGGFNMGPFSLVSEGVSLHTLQHEFGHSIQTCIFGPLIFPFVVIPSVCRYWYRTIKKVYEPAYDYAWFEGLATLFGERYYEALNRKTS